jgi:chromosome segregation ATPase
MKLYLIIVFAVVSVALAGVLFMTKKNDAEQFAADATSLTDCSNRLEAAQAQVAARDSAIYSLSNSLAECSAASVTLSNQLSDAQSSLAAKADQITALNQQVTAAGTANQALTQNLIDLTNQLTTLQGRMASTEAGLAQTNQLLVQAYRDYSLLENRFLLDVAERTIVERKFNNLVEVKAQEKNLKQFPAKQITHESIYAGLGVEVHADGSVHAIAPQ